MSAAYELVLQRKAIGAEALAAQRDAVMGGQYPQLKSKMELLTDLRRQIAQKTLAGPGEEDAHEHLRILEEWIRKKEQLEAELAQEIPEMNLEQKLRKIDLAAVSQVLPQQHVLVEFVRFTLENFDFDMDRKGSSPLHYLAFVVHASKPETLQMIDLGGAEPIDELISQLRSYITQPPSNGDGRGLGRIPVDELHEKWEMIGDQLRRALFDPLVDALQRCSNLMLAPDGDLPRLPFEILPIYRGRLLIDDYHISDLSTGRDILRIGVETAVQPGESLVIADPDYDLGSDVPKEYVASIEHQSRDLRGADIHFHRLPKSRLEGQRIGKMLDTQPWLAENVLEENLKNCRSPRILHMATHGFFLTDQQMEKSPMNRGLGSVSLPDEAEFTRLAASNLENPLLRSGLALAGAQTWLNKGDLPKAAEDGILTAEDVSGLDLLATQLVVLSACETGLGEIRTSEGVFGLRRAFVLAGAKTLVMSLWSVPDDQTQELMEEFYLRLLGGQSRAEALREAQLLIRASSSRSILLGCLHLPGRPRSAFLGEQSDSSRYPSC